MHRSKQGRYSITSSARASSDDGTSRPSAFAVLDRHGASRAPQWLNTRAARHEDHVWRGLEATGLVSAGGRLTVDVLKVPHHGSDRNVELDFFKRIVAKTYVISGDGNYGNPDRDTLQMIADARGKTASYTILLTYDVTKIDTKRKANVLKKGKIWEHNRDSLEAFFTDADQEGFAFSVHAGAPATVNLGDESIAW